MLISFGMKTWKKIWSQSSEGEWHHLLASIHSVCICVIVWQISLIPILLSSKFCNWMTIFILTTLRRTKLLTMKLWVIRKLDKYDQFLTWANSNLICITTGFHQKRGRGGLEKLLHPRNYWRMEQMGRGEKGKTWNWTCILKYSKLTWSLIVITVTVHLIHE